jgi:hypothetical protein
MILIAHTDDFRWFGPEEDVHEWDSLVATFNNHGYDVTDATEEDNYNYYMDQHRMIDSRRARELYQVLISPRCWSANVRHGLHYG